MSPLLRPTAALMFTLDGTDATPDTALAVRRSYSYVAPTRVVKAPTGKTPEAENRDEGAPGNEIALEVRLGHPYWNGGKEPEADKTWEDTVLPWLSHKLDKLMGTVRECNNDKRQSFAGVVDYRRVSLLLDGCDVSFELEPGNGLRPVADPLRAARAQCRARRGTRGGVRCVRVPSDARRGGEDWMDVTYADGTDERVPLAC